MFCLLLLPLPFPVALAFFLFFFFCLFCSPPCGQCDWSTWPSHLPAKVAPLCLYQLSHRPCSKSSLPFALWSSFICWGSSEVLPWPLGHLDKIWFGHEDSCFCVSLCVMLNITADWSVQHSTSATIFSQPSTLWFFNRLRNRSKKSPWDHSSKINPQMEWSHQAVRAVNKIDRALISGKKKRQKRNRVVRLLGSSFFGVESHLWVWKWPSSKWAGVNVHLWLCTRRLFSRTFGRDAATFLCASNYLLGK